MLTEICAYLKNWFDYGRFIGHITVSNGQLFCDGEEIVIDDGQYFALFRTHFQLGVYKKGENPPPVDKEFDGAVWLMDPPEAFLALAKDIADWVALYGGADSTALSPYTSESFGNYSYSKRGAGGNSSDGDGGGDTWQNMFAARLNLYRKI